MTVLIPYFLTRQPSTEQGTFGTITDSQGHKICVTCELPWRDNQPQKSCIPIGTYTVIPHNSAAHPNTWELENVPDRTGILIHNGNTEADSLGCIIVGRRFGTLNGIPAVLESNLTLQMLRAVLPTEPFLLIIQNQT